MRWLILSAAMISALAMVYYAPNGMFELLGWLTVLCVAKAFYTEVER